MPNRVRRLPACQFAGLYISLAMLAIGNTILLFMFEAALLNTNVYQSADYRSVLNADQSVLSHLFCHI